MNDIYKSTNRIRNYKYHAYKPYNILAFKHCATLYVYVREREREEVGNEKSHL